MLPPSPLVKKCMPATRSSSSIVATTVIAGKAKAIRIAVHSAVQVNSGMRIRNIPGARFLRMVTMKLMPVRVEPMPEISTAQIQ